MNSLRFGVLVFLVNTPAVLGHVPMPGYEEAKRRANAGLVEPTTKDVVKLSDNVGELDGPIFGGSFLGDTEVTAFPPDLTLAAGHNHLAAATNQSVKVFDKEGTQLNAWDLCGFFNRDGVTRCRLTDTNPAFDPRVLYDEYLDRFWVIAASKNDVPEPLNRRSSLFIGLSNSGDPTAAWTLFSLDAMLEVNQNGRRDSGLWCDHPMAGIDAQALYITCNMATFTDGIIPPIPRYAKLRIMTKQQFIERREILWWDFFDGDLCEGLGCLARSFSIQPAYMHSAQPSEGEFLINSVPLGGFTLTVRRVTNAQRCCVPDGQSAPTLEAHYQNVGIYGIPRNARQRGTPIEIDTGNTELQFAVWRGGLLSTGHNLSCAFLSGSCVSFTELDVSGYPGTIRTVNDWVLDPGAGVDVYYPAADVNASDNKTMVFSRSGEFEFASAAFIGIPSSSRCTHCQDGPDRFLSGGRSTYVNIEPDLLHRNRWGDYSGAAADPDGIGIWIYGEFVSATDTWAGEIGVTQRALRNPIPHVASLSPSTVFVDTPELTLSVFGADFVQQSEARLNGSPRATTFVNTSLLTVTLLPADVQTERVVQLTVFNPTPGGGTSEPVGLFICAGSIIWSGPGNGLWQTPANWNTGVLPGPGDDVCIGPRARVILSGGSQSIRSLRSQGGLEISGIGSLSITNPSFINNALTISGSGTLTGSGDLALSGVFVWTGGNLSGSGAVNANAGMVVGDENPKHLTGRTLTNNGLAIWTGSNYAIWLGDGAVFNNLGTFDARGDGNVNFNGGAPVAFNNVGTFLKSAGNGTTEFYTVAFNNAGAVAVQTGTLSLEFGGSGGGSFAVALGSTLSFEGDHTLSGSVTGDGTVKFGVRFGGTSNLSGIYNVAGTTHVTHGTVNFNPGMTQVGFGPLNVAGTGTLNLSGGIPVVPQGTVTLAESGTLTGSASLTVSQLFTWSGGTIRGSGEFIVNGGMEIPTGYNSKFLIGRTLTNNATALWTDSSFVLSLGDGAAFNNQGTFDARADGMISFNGGAPVAFNNTGAFLKSAGSRATTIYLVPFNNSGTLSAQTGTLDFSGGYTQAAGVTSLEGGALASATTMNIQGGSLSGFGTLTANVSNAGTASPGSSVPGALNIIGNYACDPNANLNVRLGGRMPGEFDVLAVLGSAGLAGALNVTLVGAFTPSLGDSFDVMRFSSSTGSFSPNLPPLPPGLGWDVQYGANALTLNVIAAGPRSIATARSN